MIVASEMDDDPGWRALEPGELVHVGTTGRLESTVVLDRPPAHPLDDLQPRAAGAQAPPGAAHGA